MSDDRDTDEHGNPLCGEPCKTGGACSNVATNPDGSCHIPSHGPGEADGPSTGGRPTKLTPERQQAICSDLEEGHSINVAAETNGINADTYYRWRRRGKAAAEADEEGPYREFYERTTRARREGERQWAERAMKYAVEADSFGAAMEILRKRYPGSWTSAAHEDEDEDRLRVLLSNEDAPDGAGQEYTMRADDGG